LVRPKNSVQQAGDGKLYKQTSRFFRDMNIRGPDDFGPTSNQKKNRPKVYRIKKILKETISGGGTVWVTAQVYEKSGTIKGRLLRPDDREWMIKCKR